MSAKVRSGFLTLLGKAADVVSRQADPASTSLPTPLCSITALLDAASMTSQQHRHLETCRFCSRRAKALEELPDGPDEHPSG